MRKILVRRVRPRCSRAGDHGVALVELGALTPIIGLVAVVVWQIILVGITSMFAGHAAAEGARQAAVTPFSADKIESQAKKRIPAPWNEDTHFEIDSVDRNNNTYIQVQLNLPAFVPAWGTPYKVGGEAKVVFENNVE